MNLSDLFFSLDGRIGRAKFWFGTFVLLAISAAATYAILFLVGVSQAAVAFSAAVAFALAYPYYAVVAKRFQDRGRPGALACRNCLRPVKEDWGLRRFYFRDPAGNLVNVVGN